MASSKSKQAAAKRLKRLDQEYEAGEDKKKRAQLRSQAAMGSRATRREAASTLGSMERQKRQASTMRKGPTPLTSTGKKKTSASNQGGATIGGGAAAGGGGGG